MESEWTSLRSSIHLPSTWDLGLSLPGVQSLRSLSRDGGTSCAEHVTQGVGYYSCEVTLSSLLFKSYKFSGKEEFILKFLSLNLTFLVGTIQQK